MNSGQLEGDVALPPDLLEAIASEPGGRVVLVVGAGTSVEAPMELPMAQECARLAHRELVHDGVLQEGDCPDPDDLSVLADTVFDKTSGQQVELVRRLPVDRFRVVRPNRGCLLAAALLREQALAGVITLNFDLGLVNALSHVGFDDDVSLLAGPRDHGRMGTTNLVYLHRDANADPEEWVLRTDAIEVGWKQGWEQVVVGLLVGGPFTVFVGLGSPAGVLVDTARRIQAALPQSAKLLQVDPSAPEDSAMRERLAISDDDYLQLGWGAFMEQLASRLHTRHCDELHDACMELIDREGLPEGDPRGVCEGMIELGLIDAGEVRARWLLERRQLYLPRRKVNMELIAWLVIAIAVIERHTDTIAHLHPDGVVEFLADGQIKGAVVLASAQGTKGWASVEADLSQPAFARSRRPIKPRCALVAGIGPRLEVAPPPSLLSDKEDPDSIIDGGSTLILRSVDELVAQPELAKELVA